MTKTRSTFSDFIAPLLLLTLVLIGLLSAVRANADDGIFPAAPAAKSAIDFDGRGFLIHGRREFLASGTLHYPRVPRQLWRDRLLRIKAAGFNCVGRCVSSLAGRAWRCFQCRPCRTSA